MPSIADARPVTSLWVVAPATIGQAWRMIRALTSLFVAASLWTAPLYADSDDDALREGLRLAGAKDWPAAQAVVAGADPVVVDLIEWLRLRAGEGRLGDYEAFLARRPHWPGLAFLKQKGEIAVARSTDPARVIAYFGAGRPQSGEGAVALVRAYMQSSRPAEAETEALRVWTTLSLTAEDEKALLDLKASSLDVAHEVRLDNLLWQGNRRPEVTRMLPRVSADWQALARARLALQADENGITALIDAVPPSLSNDAGLAYDRFVWRMRKDRYDDAAALILERSSTPAGLGRPQAWAERRAVLARWLMRNGKTQDAYRVAASHHLTEGADLADLEFLAGFIALRKLDDPVTALGHFNRLKQSVRTAISLSRADYWIGRSLERRGDTAGAEAAYQDAARHHTAYYGLLAAEKLGQTLNDTLIQVGGPTRNYKTVIHKDGTVISAARHLLRAGNRSLAKRFFLHATESLDLSGREAMADHALLLDEPHIALAIAKQAAEQGWIMPRSYYPVSDMVPDSLAVSRAFALAISRRESEFDPEAQSSAGARGLMQLMPETAARVAKDLGLDHSTAMLTTDPAHNARLGAAYLARLIEEFGPSVALVASGYNAGPGRPRRWITEFGDPRQSDPVDWVETIPFTETRTYVMRVTESLVIYRQRLKGQAGPVRITAELTGN